MNRLALMAAVGCGLGLGWLPSSYAQKQDKLAGNISADGSSTVYLITEAMGSKFKKQHPKVNITAGISGTGGGFKKFAAGETDIQNAARPITPAEAEKCKENKIHYQEFQVAWDALVVIVHKDNTWAAKMTREQLKQIWNPKIAAKKWSDVNPKWPNERIELYGPGPDSSAFDFFTEAINGKARVSRTDYGASENEIDTIAGAVKNKYALGYVTLAYYEANKDRLRAVAVAEGAGGPYIDPTLDNITTRKYLLSRPLFIYVNTHSLRQPQVREFVRFHLRNPKLVTLAHYLPLTAQQQKEQSEKLETVLRAVK